MAHNVRDLKEALAARSQTATLEELSSRGRRSVRVIRADDVAQMIEAAVGQTIARSGLMSPQEVDELEAKSREQFQLLLERRQGEISELRQATDELRGAQEELTAAQAERAALATAAQKMRGQVEDLRGRLEAMEPQRNEAVERLRASELQREELVAALRGSEGEVAQAEDNARQTASVCAKALEQAEALRAERDAALATVKALEAQLVKAQKETSTTVASGVNADLVYRMMSEIAELRAKAAAPAARPDRASSDALAGALNQLTSTFTAKLESFGRKMGVSSAVEAEAPSLTSLFKHEDGVKLESNMDNVSVKAKTGTGIAANLERLKKLKGGG